MDGDSGSFPTCPRVTALNRPRCSVLSPNPPLRPFLTLCILRPQHQCGTCANPKARLQFLAATNERPACALVGCVPYRSLRRLLLLSLTTSPPRGGSDE